MTATSPAASPATVPVPAPEGGRVQLALNVDDLDTAVAFYTSLLGTGPAKVRDGYANFAVATPPLKLVLLENPGKGGTLNHLGVEVRDTEEVQAEIARLTAAGLVADPEQSTTCCYATQDKAWVTGPGGERWEVYTVLADSPTFGAAPSSAEGDVCCGTAADQATTVPAAVPATEPAAPACC